MTEDYFAGMTEEDIKSYKEAESKIEEEREESYEKNTQIIRNLKKTLPKRLFRAICSALYESENWDKLRIVTEPTGTEQKQENRGFKFSMWVDQYTEFEDSYSGYCYIELPGNVFLAWNYWM